MPNLTALQCISYTQAKVGKIDNQYLDKGLMLIDLSLSQREVQNDLMALLGMKVFTKQASIAGTNGVFVLPADLRAEPNSIIDVKATTGIKAYIESAFGSANAEMRITYNEYGTVGNGAIVTFLDSGDPGGKTAGTVEWAWTGVVDFNVWVDGVMTTNELIAILNADFLFKIFFTVSLKTGSNGTGTPSPYAFTLANGANTGTYYPIKTELDIEDYNRFITDFYRQPSITEPTATRMGDSSGTPKLYMLPSTITYINLFYRYKLGEITADTDSLSVPLEYEPLVLQKFLAKTYEMIKAQQESENAKAEYTKKVNEAVGGYMNMTASIQSEKTRLQSDNQSK